MFQNQRFDVEHALNMYVTDFVLMPAQAIYDNELLEPYVTRLPSCHIYMIGLVPKIEKVSSINEGGDLVTVYEIGGEQKKLFWKLPDGCVFEQQDADFCVPKYEGRIVYPAEDMEMAQLKKEIAFEVLYVGQGYGKEGSRSALDRLKKHETLQKIAVENRNPAKVLQLLLLEIEPANRVLTVINPAAADLSSGEERLKNGLDKVDSTTAAEKITLYEASLIRYFEPKYNKEFKESFPSTKYQVLKDCYDKDLSAIVAELCNDELPPIGSAKIAATNSHMIVHNLHTDKDRRAFFSTD